MGDMMADLISAEATGRTQDEVDAELASLDAIEAELLLAGNDGMGEGEGEPTEPDYEAEAGRKGWVSKDKFKGPEGKWVDAKTFVQRGERFASNLIREVAELKQQIAAFEGTKKAFAKFHEETLAKKDAEIVEALSALRRQRVEAMQEGDTEQVLEIEDRIDLLKDQQKTVKATPAKQEEEPAAPSAGVSDPVLQEWIEDGNSWFKDDMKLSAYAIKVGEELLAKGETARGRKFLDRVTEIMAEEFPRKFKDRAVPAGGRQNPVEGGGGAPRSAGGSVKTERDLPAEDLALMRQFIAEGWTTKEKFLASYFSRNG